jgi:ATP-dependent RNA helicase DeaD
MVCNAGSITKDDIGAIRIQAKESYVEIRQTILEEFQNAVGPEGKLEDNIRLRKLDKAPDLDKIQRQPRSDYGCNKGPSGGPSGGRKHSGEKARSSHRGRDAKPDFSENRKPRVVQTERSLPDPRPERFRPDGVVTPIKGSKSGDSKPSQGYKKKNEGKGKPKPVSGKASKSDGYTGKNAERERPKPVPWSKRKGSDFSKSKTSSGGLAKDGDSEPKTSSSKNSPSEANRYRAPANDTSKRFVPPGGSKTAKRHKSTTQVKSDKAGVGTAKPFGKPKVTRGPNAVPRRPKQK